MSAAGGPDDGGGGRKSKVPRLHFLDREESENTPKKLPVEQNPIVKKPPPPLVPFIWGKMSSQLPMRASLERQYRRPDESSATSDDQDSTDAKIRNNEGKDKDDEANSKKSRSSS